MFSEKRAGQRHKTETAVNFVSNLFSYASCRHDFSAFDRADNFQLLSGGSCVVLPISDHAFLSSRISSVSSATIANKTARIA